MAAGSAVCSSGRSARRLHPRMITSTSALSQIETALSRDAVAGFLAHEGAAAGGDHRRAVVEQACDHPRLAIPKMRLAMGLKNVRDRHPGRRLDLGIGVEERQPQPGRQPPADGGFAGAHHADQHDAARAQRRREGGVLGGWLAPVWLSQASDQICSKNCRVPRHLYYPRRCRCQRLLQREGEHVGSQAVRPRLDFNG